MIILKQKPVDEILKSLENSKSVLIAGCDGCAGIYQVGGEKQAELMSSLLKIAKRIKANTKIKTGVTTILRQCDRQIVVNHLQPMVQDYDTILSLACGIGVQTLAGIFEDKPVLPANNTMFIGMEDYETKKFYEFCGACGECVLSDTASICPLTRCSKHILNGPCGGFAKGKCEVGEGKRDCAWVQIFNRLKTGNRLDLFLKFRPPRDYRVSASPRELGFESTISPAIQERSQSPESVPISSPPKSKEIYSELMKKISEGKFVVTGEVEPVKTTDLREVLEAAKRYKGHVVAVNVTDNPTAFAYMNALIPSYFIQKEVGLEVVYQMVTRDRNRLILTSDLLAAGALGIKNILAIAGDSVTFGDNPQANPVWDLDSTQFIYMIRKMVDEGVDLAGKKIHNPPKFHVGAAANPNADPLEPEVYKLLRKQEVGVDFLQTQSTYDIEIVKRFLELADSVGVKVPILIGVTPFKNIPMMEWMVKFVPGVVIPSEVQERLYKANEIGKEKFVEENVEIFGELCKEIKKMKVAGIHMMPIGFEWIAPPVLERAGIKTQF